MAANKEMLCDGALENWHTNKYSTVHNRAWNVSSVLTEHLRPPVWRRGLRRGRGHGRRLGRDGSLGRGGCRRQRRPLLQPVGVPPSPPGLSAARIHAPGGGHPEGQEVLGQVVGRARVTHGVVHEQGADVLAHAEAEKKEAGDVRSSWARARTEINQAKLL